MVQRVKLLGRGRRRPPRDHESGVPFETSAASTEAGFRSLFENAVIGMALVDSDGGFVHVNPAFCRQLGRSEEQLRRLRWPQVLHPDDRELASTDRLRQLGASRDLYPLELRYLHGEAHSVRANVVGASIGPTEEGRAYTLVQSSELTEQRRLEEAAGRLYELTTDLLCTVGFDGYFKSLNPAWERVLGYNASELMSRPFIEFVHPDDRAQTRREFEHAQAGRPVTVDYENRYLHRDGSYRWLLWSGRPSPEEQLLYGVAKDVTERRRSEERVRQSERKYRDLVETSSDLIWSVDTRGRFSFVNRAARRIYGYEPEEMLGRAIGDFESSEQRQRDEKAFRRVLAGETLRGYETTHVRKDGVHVDLSVNAIALYDDSGAVVGATGTATDVTERNRFQQRQAVVAELGRRALEGASLSGITEATVRLVVETLATEYGAVFELVPPADQLELKAAVGWPDELIGARFPATAKESHAGHAIRVDGPVLVEDFHEERRFGRPEQLPATSGVCVTIEGEPRPFGALCVHSVRRRPFSVDEVNFLQAAANVLAAAIGRKRTEQRIVELAAARGRLVAQTLAAEDRARRAISEILHDHALQDLLASRQDLVEVIEDPDGDPERVIRAREGIERAVQLLREAVFNLHPAVLEHAGLASAIRAIADHQARRGGFECEIEVAPDATGIHDELILSLARELLTNVAKHARARRALVTVRRDGSSIELCVEDDGHGIGAGRRETALYEGHVGLASSAERVEALAGRFELDSSPGKGTRVRAILPARREAPDPEDRSRPARLSASRRASGR